MMKHQSNILNRTSCSCLLLSLLLWIDGSYHRCLAFQHQTSSFNTVFNDAVTVNNRNTVPILNNNADPSSSCHHRCRRQPTFLCQARSRKYYDDDDDDDEEEGDNNEYEYARVRRGGRRGRYRDDENDNREVEENADDRERSRSKKTKYYEDEDDDDDDAEDYYDDEYNEMLNELDEKIPYKEEYDGRVIPNAELDDLDPEGTAERFPQVLKDPKFWRDTILIIFLYNFIHSIGHENVVNRF